MRTVLVTVWLSVMIGHGYAHALSDAEIQVAIDKGRSTPTKALSHELGRKAIRVSRGTSVLRSS